jgi:hypothetical protein
MTDFELDSSNELFRTAASLVNHSSRNIFLTGKAGTGKTTFLKYIRENCHKQIAVTAPTGVAAINAGGVTLHSFFQLPLSPFIPADGGFRRPDEEVTGKSSLLSRLRMSAVKRKVIQELELLIIDEISMVRCDVLDAVDTVLRHIRRRHHENFGGVQVVLIGDMHQLPPVVKDGEWSLLKDYYNSPYFFDSLAIKSAPPVFIEFEKIYRQSEEKFISVLNQVRHNELDEEGRRQLESRYHPSFHHNSSEGYIILTTHNEKARMINENELHKLPNPLFAFEAETKGDFPETAWPADERLQLKKGAQVMFIKNDTEKVRRYFNGKIGVVTGLDDESIIVQCPGDAESIEVKKETWENIRYTLDKNTRQLEEEVLGTFSQYPLRLAWAITIHKSQGLTFNKTIIDAGDSFAPGQVYVALSRCTTLEGIVLLSRIKPSGMFTDERIVRFSQNNSSKDNLYQELQQAKKNYQLQIVLSLFDYDTITEAAKDLSNYLLENKTSFQEECLEWTENLVLKTGSLQATASKFQVQIERLFQQTDNPSAHEPLIERLKAGAAYFTGEQKALLSFIQATALVTDSRQHAKEINESLKELFILLSRKQYLLEGFSGKFDAEAFHRRKKSFTAPPFSINTYAGVAKQKVESPQPLLYQRLRKLRDAICERKDLPIYFVAGSHTLDEMARYLPQSLEELRKISGFGDVKIEKYGQPFLDIILEYCREKNLSSLIHEKIPKRERKSKTGEKKAKTDTKAETFRLYKSGKSAAEIAKERNLTLQTIEGHLAYYVFRKEIDIYDLVSREKIVLIETELRKFTGGSVLPVKQKLGDAVSFGEIRLVMAWLDSQKEP